MENPLRLYRLGLGEQWTEGYIIISKDGPDHLGRGKIRSHRAESSKGTIYHNHYLRRGEANWDHIVPNLYTTSFNL